MGSKIYTQLEETFVLPTFGELTVWFNANAELGIGIIITVFGLFMTLSELRVYYVHNSTSEQLMFWLMVLVAGVSTTISRDFVLGILLGISLLMVVETIRMWSTPVWGKLMAATMATYLVILGGKIGQVAYDAIVQPENPNDQIFSAAFNVAFYVFLAVAFFFFGKKFILVSRFSSPQIVYLFLFGAMYIFIARFFPRNEDGIVLTYNYLGIEGLWRTRVMFADFGTFEALTLVMVFMYFISGWLLSTLFGVTEVTDPVLLEKVRIVARQMGIEEEMKVGFVRAPILNAFAYGPWFDKRIAFIANDVEDFSDADIRGIVGHELAHAANHHVLILLFLSIFELFIKKILGLPATTLDYTFIPDNAVQTVSFAWYYVISYGMLIVLMIFVRILEGHADKKTLEAGYGKDLSQALFRLEGFYNGVAADFGISVNLLTDRVYTLPEKRRFTAQAARNLYNEVLKPTRGSAFANIFQSHPRTSYRIASLVDDDIDPLKGAFLPYRLLGFFLRSGAIEQLNEIHEDFRMVLDESYDADYGDEGLSQVLEFNPWKEPYNALLGKQVISYSKFDKRIIIGELKDITQTGIVSAPFQANVGEETVNLSTSTVKEYYPEQPYLLKNGEIAILKSARETEKGSMILDIMHNDEMEELKLGLLGKPLTFLTDLVGKEVLFFKDGITQLSTLDELDLEAGYLDGQVVIDGETYSGRDLIVSFPPLGFEIRKTRLEEQRPLLNYLVGKKSLVYTKENFDISLAVVVKEVTETHMSISDADGDRDIPLEEVEYVMFAEPTIEIIKRDHISLFTKVGLWWGNRNEFSHIF
ncbi:MAG: M48 family metallopeptidase [Candidatus Kariarchaeaceae archaeon]|jgi:Zn-dependent protease with chaperone function